MYVLTVSRLSDRLSAARSFLMRNLVCVGGYLTINSRSVCMSFISLKIVKGEFTS